MLQSQCRRLEAQNYNLSLTAEQLSHSMGVRRTCTAQFINAYLLHISLPSAHALFIAAHNIHKSGLKSTLQTKVNGSPCKQTAMLANLNSFEYLLAVLVFKAT